MTSLDDTTTAPAPHLGGPRAGTTRIGVVAGTTRPGRKASSVADWVCDAAGTHGAVQSGSVQLQLQVLDLAAVALPLLDEPMAAAFGQYRHAHTRAWAATVASCDGFVFVTPEYNHSIPAALKNAIDYLFAEWHHKPVGIVSYGLMGGVRAAEHLRVFLLEVRALPIASQVAMAVFEDFTYTDPTDPTSAFKMAARDHQSPALFEMLDDLLADIPALTALRTVGPGHISPAAVDEGS